MFTRTQYFLRVKFRDLILMWDNWLVFCVKMLVCTIWLIFIQFFLRTIASFNASTLDR